MKFFARLIPSFLRKSKSNNTVDSPDLFRKLYDVVGVRQRIVTSIVKTGKTEDEVNALLGIDSSLLPAQRVAQYPEPSMELIGKLSNFIGVSIPYILYGKVENEVDRFVVGLSGNNAAALGNVESSSVLQGVTAGSITVHHFAPGDLSQAEVEVVELLRRLSPRQKSEALSFLFDMEPAR